MQCPEGCNDKCVPGLAKQLSTLTEDKEVLKARG